MGKKRNYSLRQSGKILKEAHRLWQRRRHKIPGQDVEEARQLLLQLQRALENKDVALAATLAVRVEERVPDLCPEPIWVRWGRFLGGLALLLLVLIPIRQMWWEQYWIPSGSMRPTLKEQDRVVVSKTAFGFNRPYFTGQLTFDPARLQPGEIVVFDTQDLPGQELWDRFLNVLPVRKKLVKRCLGRSAETLYFYGGQIYALDCDGKEISVYRDPEWMQGLEYIPFIRPEGHLRGVKGAGKQVRLLQWQRAMGRWTRLLEGSWQAQVCAPEGWRPARPLERTTAYPEDGPHGYADLWGFRHYGLCRLVPVEKTDTYDDASLKAMLEVWHSPQMRPVGGATPDFGVHLSRALVPVGPTQWQALRHALYTARFQVVHGYAYKVGQPGSIEPTRATPQLPGVPDGTYEFQDGKAFAIHFGGITQELAQDHPLYGDALLPTLFNLGIEFHRAFEQAALPSRFAYFRHGDLYVMGHPVWTSADPLLSQFLAAQEHSEGLPFQDYGPPTAEQIATFGFKVPPEHFIALGDNHAQSGDTREFGPVPTANLAGSPSFLLWPPSPGPDARLGSLPQPPRPWLTWPNVVVTIGALTVLIGLEVWNRRRQRVRLDP